MRAARTLFFLVCMLVVPHLHAADMAGAEASPHAEAIRLVMQHRANEVRKMDEADQWWHDTEERTWSAKRPFAPGIVDSTHLFIVTYAIGGHVVGTWRVDTRIAEVEGGRVRNEAWREIPATPEQRWYPQAQTRLRRGNNIGTLRW
ncbi:hypothetical protein M8R20_31210 [Pseudomonas sp. R2.Fl]|nr:hypothetical protein [Pseudomonas sp. R2.Fl]